MSVSFNEDPHVNQKLLGLLRSELVAGIEGDAIADTDVACWGFDSLRSSLEYS